MNILDPVSDAVLINQTLRSLSPRTEEAISDFKDWFAAVAIQETAPRVRDTEDPWIPAMSHIAALAKTVVNRLVALKGIPVLGICEHCMCKGKVYCTPCCGIKVHSLCWKELQCFEACLFCNHSL